MKCSTSAAVRECIHNSEPNNRTLDSSLLTPTHITNLDPSKLKEFVDTEQNRTEHIFYWTSTSVHSQILHDLYNKAFIKASLSLFLTPPLSLSLSLSPNCS